MAHAKSYLRTPDKASPPVYETRPATETDCRKIATRLIPASMDEVTALSKFAPVSFLFQNRERKRVIVDWSKPDWPVAILDVAPVSDWDEAVIWVGRTENATAPDKADVFDAYCRTLFDQLNRSHLQLLYYVPAGNVTQRSWLEQFGFIPYRQLSHYGDKQVEFNVMRRAPANV